MITHNIPNGDTSSDSELDDRVASASNTQNKNILETEVVPSRPGDTSQNTGSVAGAPGNSKPPNKKSSTMIDNLISAARSALSAQSAEETQWGDACCEQQKAKHFWRIGYRLDGSRNPIGIVWDRAPNAQSMSSEERSLFENIEKDAVRVRAAFRLYPQESKDLFEKLRTVAKVGLCGEVPNAKLAESYYKSFKNEVPIAANKVRKKFLQGTLVRSGVVLLLALVAYATLLMMHTTVFYNLQSSLSECVVSNSEVPRSSAANNAIANKSALTVEKHCTEFPTSWGLFIVKTFFPNWVHSYARSEPTEFRKKQAEAVARASNLGMGYALAIVGCAIGIAVMAYIRNRQITYESFDAIYQYGMSPGRYLLFVAVLALVVLILVSFDAVIVGIGGITLNEVGERHWLGILIGLLCGVSEPLVASMVTTRIRPVEGTTDGAKG